MMASGRTGPDLICSPEQIVPYLLFQAILKYERSPTLDSHTAFVVSMKGTSLQFNKAEVSREYLKDLISQKVPRDTLTLLRSELYDMMEQDSRREFVRGFSGMVRHMRSQFGLYEHAESSSPA
ncbi:hypothetical protein FQN54_003600 [Arachnomyces sp. PD_36]|nr:hypothetical protein FQN54_003600 [Arachnomyces sp. PD_36]